METLKKIWHYIVGLFVIVAYAVFVTPNGSPYTEVSEKYVYFMTCSGVKTSVTALQYNNRTPPSGCASGYSALDFASLSDGQYYTDQSGVFIKNHGTVYKAPPGTKSTDFETFLNSLNTASSTDSIQ